MCEAAVSSDLHSYLLLGSHLLFGMPYNLMKRFSPSMENVVLLIECSLYARTSHELVAQLCFNDLVFKWRFLMDTVGEKKNVLKVLQNYSEIKVFLLPEAEWHSQQ